MSFDVLFDLRLIKRLSKQSCGWWFETPSGSLWRHCNVQLYEVEHDLKKLVWLYQYGTDCGWAMYLTLHLTRRDWHSDMIWSRSRNNIICIVDSLRFCEFIKVKGIQILSGVLCSERHSRLYAHCGHYSLCILIWSHCTWWCIGCVSRITLISSFVSHKISMLTAW